ncbi:MAG: NAD(P)-dependent oxidoreductase [Planctomycetes bacterium]|nr:NAD(P)-dependent oxidoreductase [Planctomycetota bacterium]
MAETFLITGGQGFIGAWTAKALLDEGTPFVLFDLTPSNSILSQVIDPERLPEVERAFGDIADRDTVRKTVERRQITYIIHLAGLQVPACRADPVQGARVNVIGTLNVFEAARASGGRVAGIVYASSAAVAGDPEDYEGPLRDDSPHRPRTHYGVFKSANEGSARVYFLDHGLPSVGLRPYTVYGVGREVGLTSGPTKAVKAAVLQRPYTIPFTGGTSFVHVEDLARIFIACVRSRPPAALALNVRGEVDTVENFIARLEEVLPDCRGRITASGNQIPMAYDLDQGGLEKLLAGRVPKTPLAEGIRLTAERFRLLAEQGRLHDRDLAG